MSKKGKHAAHADERWLLTYADMITLLMALFIVMFAISVVNTGKFAMLAQSLKSSFSGDVLGGSPSLLSTGSPNFNVQTSNSPSSATPDPIPEASTATAQASRTEAAKKAVAAAAAAQRTQEEQLSEARKAVDQRVAQLGLQEKVVTTIDERGLVIRLVTDDVIFGSGSAAIAPAGTRLLKVVADAVDPLPLPIHVEGHTDANPFDGDPLGNFKLSMDRGKSVAVFLLENGVDPREHRGDVTGTGYGDYRPLPGIDPLDPRQRRVEIVIVRRDFADQAPKQAPGPLGANPAAIDPIDPPVADGTIAPAGATTTPTDSTTADAADAAAEPAAATGGAAPPESTDATR